MQLDLDKINTELKNKQPWEIIEWSQNTFGSGLVMSSSFGIDSSVMLHLVTSQIPLIPVILIDTGYLFPETYRFIIEMVRRFKINLKVFSSEISPDEMERVHGKLWEGSDEDIMLYNRIRKVEPLSNGLSQLGAQSILHGVRKDQTQHRSRMNTIEEGFSGTYKIHPILNWTQREMDLYITIHELPRHPLWIQGYNSMGDIHSTQPGLDREGRSLGEGSECGIHKPNDFQI
jgi:phosphoadenosine phosphosulfate reductase